MSADDRADFLATLERVHARTRRVAACIPADGLEWAPGPGRFTCGDLVRHLAGVERDMYAETVHGRPSRYAGHDRALADGLPAVLAYHAALHAESLARFAELAPADFARSCLTPAGTQIRIGRWLGLMLEHEAHHRGQIYLTLGLLGVDTPPLYGLTEAELRARSASGDSPAGAATPTESR